MDDLTRLRWITAHIFPCEGEVRHWLRRHIRTLPPADHDDLLQEAYARIWQEDPDRITNARGYFYTIVKNLLLEQARRARIVPMERMSEIESARFATDEPGPEQRVTARQEFENLCRIVATLPAKCGKVFQLKSFEGYSRKEIAARLGISERTVEKHLEKAHLRIGDAMSEAQSELPHRTAHARNSEHDAN